MLVAEIDLKNKDQQFDLPPWVEKKVSDNKQYYNAYLSEHTFNKWK